MDSGAALVVFGVDGVSRDVCERIRRGSTRDDVDAFSTYWLARGATLEIRRKLSWGAQLDTPSCVPVADRIPCQWALTTMHVFWDGRVPRGPGDTEGDERPATLAIGGGARRHRARRRTPDPDGR